MIVYVYTYKGRSLTHATPRANSRCSHKYVYGRLSIVRPWERAGGKQPKNFEFHHHRHLEKRDTSLPQSKQRIENEKVISLHFWRKPSEIMVRSKVPSSQVKRFTRTSGKFASPFKNITLSKKKKSKSQALREIRILQKTTNLLIPKSPFLRLVRRILSLFFSVISKMKFTFFVLFKR